MVGSVNDIDLSFEDFDMASSVVEQSESFRGSGYCYLTIVKDRYRDEIGESYGAWPHIEDILRLSILKLDGTKLFTSFLVRNGSLWHFAEQGGLRVAEVFRAAACRAAEVYKIGSIGASYQVTAGLVQPSLLKLGVCERIGGDIGQVHSELLELSKLDFGECRCKVHSVPVTADTTKFGLGCAQKPAGKAGVIAAAYAGKPGMCHADQVTRDCDKQFLEHVISGQDPGLLAGVRRSHSFDRLCTSSDSTDLGAFGNGYCYLSLLHKDTWWRVARLLGPNPLLRSLYPFLLWAGKPSSKSHKLLRVADDYYHVVEDKLVKGVSSTAGLRMAEEVLRTFIRWPNAKVGAWVYEPGDPLVGPRCELVGNFKKRIVDMALGGVDDSCGLVWLNDGHGYSVSSTFESALDVSVSGLLSRAHTPPCSVTDSKFRGTWVKFSAAARSRAAVVLPMGWTLHYQGVSYGSAVSHVAFAFRGRCDVWVIPPSLQAAGELVVLTGPRLEWSLDQLLHPKSTDARFVRQCAASVVLAFPKRAAGLVVAEPGWRVISVTDPLEDWCAVRETRFESHGCGVNLRLGDVSFMAFKNFRSHHSAGFIIDDFVRIADSDATVVVAQGDRYVRVDACHCDHVVDVDWSIRSLLCVDSYCMDDGGPSDSEFSDAI